MSFSARHRLIYSTVYVRWHIARRGRTPPCKRNEQMHLDDSWLLFWNPQRWKDPLRCTQSCLRPSPLLCLLCPYACSFIYLLYLSVSFRGCSRCHPALSVEVLEKTVEGEAVALTKAKTLYKSCINDRKWAQVESWLVMLQVCPVVTKKYSTWYELLRFSWLEISIEWKNVFCMNTLGEIEKRGGTPLIEILPDVYDWPIAVDNWETKYGKASLCQRVPAQTSCARAISSSQWSLFFRQIVAAGGCHRQAERELRLQSRDKLFYRHRWQGLQLAYHPRRFGTVVGGKLPFFPLWGMFIRCIKQPTIFKSGFCSMTSREVSGSRLGISSPALAPLKRYVENRWGNSTLESSDSHLNAND